MSEASHSSPAKHDPLAALRQRNFVLYSSSRVFASLGQSLLQAVMAWQVYEISDSAFSLGLLGLARFFPALGISLIGGLAADTFDRRKVMLCSQVVPLACGAVLAVSTLQGWVTLDLIFGLVVLIGLASAFEGPARTALLPAIVSVETFTNAVIVNNIFQRIGPVTGPVLAGFLIAALGLGPGYIVFCACLLVAAVPLLLLRYQRVPMERQRSLKTILGAMKEGVSFVRRRQVLLGAMSLDMFAVIFGGAQALMPLYAKDILHTDAAGYGLLSAALPIGAFLTSLALVLRPPVKRTGRALVLTVVAFGLATMAFGVSREFWLSMFLYMLVGASDQVSVIMRQTTIQMATPDELRGRVSSVNQVFVQASSQIGAMESGFVAALTGAVFAVVSGGAGAILIAALIAWRLPGLYRYELGDAHEVTGDGSTQQAIAETDEASVAS